MAGPPAGRAPVTPRQRWLSGRAWRLHAALLIVVPGCLAAGWFELTRARAGNELSWVYVGEWPFFAAFAAHLWWRLIHGEDDREGPSPGTARGARPPCSPGGGHPADPGRTPGPPDPQLQAWQEYLRELHAKSPPGGPPGR